MASSIVAGTRPSAWQRWALFGLLVFVGVASVQYSLKTGSAQRSAFLRWRPQVVHLHDEDIYARYQYPNPPIMGLILLPLAELPPTAGAFAWFYLKVAMTVLAFIWAFGLVETPDRPMPAWAKGAVILLSLRPVMGDLTHGNVNLFILFLVLGALHLFRHRRDLASGVVLALAIACKITPALFVGYFVWKRAWKTVVGCGVGLALFFLFIPAGFLGWQTNLQRLHGFYELMVQPYIVQGDVTSEHQNQSLPGLAVRLLTHRPSYSTFDDQKEYVPLEYHNLADLDPRLVRWLVKGCMALFALVAVLVCRTPAGTRHGWRLAAEFSLVLLGMLLFSERTWKHHCVTLVLPFTVLAYYVAAFRPGRGLATYLVGSLVLTLFLMASTITGFGKTSSDLGKLAEVYGAYVWAYLLLVAGLVVILRRRDPAALPCDEARAQTEVREPARVH